MGGHAVQTTTKRCRAEIRDPCCQLGSPSVKFAMLAVCLCICPDLAPAVSPWMRRPLKVVGYVSAFVAIRRRIAHGQGCDKTRDDAVGWLYPTHQSRCTTQCEPIALVGCRPVFEFEAAMIPRKHEHINHQYQSEGHSDARSNT